ncbi:MAG: hypothetical protein HQK97_12020, partial [Nitrospirae bacterium]|nr:hypothetical protein [Nitrospirota bacterium]
MELVVSTASSADGTNFAVGDLSGYIHTSADSGVTWIKQTGSGNRSWITIASSSDGIKLAAADLSGYLYTSQDSGTSWTATTKSMNNTGNWMTITSSADGTSLAAAADSENNDDKGHIYTSTDSGATWTEESGAGEAPWSQLASSSDASKLVAVSQNGYIYTGVEANYQAAAA